MSRIEEIKNFLKSLAPNELEQAHSIVNDLHSIVNDHHGHSIESASDTIIDLTDDDLSNESTTDNPKKRKTTQQKEESPNKKQKTAKRINLNSLMEKMKKTRNNAPSYTKKDIQRALRLSKKWRKNLPIVTQNFFKETDQEVRNKPEFIKWENHIVADCKSYKAKCGKPFPCGFADHCLLMNGKIEDQPFGFDMCQNLERENANEFRSSKSGVFFSSRIAMYAYITLLLQRMEEVLGGKRFADKRFVDLSPKEKLSVLIEAANDFGKSYCWFGPIRLAPFEKKGRQILFPMSWIDNGPSDHDIGGTVLWRMEKHFKFGDRKMSTMGEFYEDDADSYERCEPHMLHRMIVRW